MTSTTSPGAYALVWKTTCPQDIYISAEKHSSSSSQDKPESGWPPDRGNTNTWERTRGSEPRGSVPFPKVKRSANYITLEDSDVLTIQPRASVKFLFPQDGKGPRFGQVPSKGQNPSFVNPPPQEGWESMKKSNGISAAPL